MPAPFSDKIAALESLSPDWDGYGAPAINREVLEVVAAFLANAAAERIDLVPCDGGVQIEMHADGWDVEIEFMPRKDDAPMQNIDGTWTPSAVRVPLRVTPSEATP